jgi:hypothetical protein
MGGSINPHTVNPPLRLSTFLVKRFLRSLVSILSMPAEDSCEP